MIVGICLVIAGLMLIIYPPLLSIIVASFLLFVGITVTVISYRYKRLAKRFDDPFMDFISRY